MPLVKEKAEDAELDDELLPEETATHYRSHAMRMSYLGQDRTDIQRTVRELAKGMQHPKARHEQMLTRAVRPCGTMMMGIIFLGAFFMGAATALEAALLFALASG